MHLRLVDDEVSMTAPVDVRQQVRKFLVNEKTPMVGQFSSCQHPISADLDVSSPLSLISRAHDDSGIPNGVSEWDFRRFVHAMQPAAIRKLLSIACMVLVWIWKVRV